jgi:WD40 repeat protein
MAAFRVLIVFLTLLLSPPAFAAGAQPPQPKADERKPKTDLYGDPLPPGAVARFGTVRFRHGGPVQAVAYSADGKTLISAGTMGDSYGICIWDASTGKELRRCQIPRAPMYWESAAFSADGKLLATGHENGLVQLSGVADGKRVMHFHVFDSPVAFVAFSEDGGTVAAASPKEGICAWTADEKRWLKPIYTETKFGEVGGNEDDTITALAVSSNGQQVASATQDKAIHLWKAEPGKRIRKLQGHKDTVQALAFAPDGKTLASLGADKTICLWDLATGRKLQALTFEEAYPTGRTIHFSHDGTKLALVGPGAPIHAWEVKSGKLLRKLEAPGTELYKCAAFSPDGKKLAAGGQDAMLRLWELATGRQESLSAGHQGWATSVVFTPDQKSILSSSHDGTLRWWDGATGKETRQSKSNGGYSNSIFAVGQGKIVTVDDGSCVHLWDAATGKELRRLETKDGAKCGACAPDGKIVAAVDGAKLRLWDLTTGKELRSFADHEETQYIALSPDGKLLAASPRGKTVILLDASNGKEVRLLEAPVHSVYGNPAFSPEGMRVAAMRTGGSVLQWETASGKACPEFEDTELSLAVIAYSPNGRILGAGAHDGTVVLFEVATRKEILRLSGHRGCIFSLAFSADGRSLASASWDTTVLVWDLTGPSRQKERHSGRLESRELDALWADLESEDAPKAYRARWQLASVPDVAVPFLRERLLLDPEPKPGHIARLILDLDSEEFAVRDKSAKELEKLGDVALAACRKALDGQPSPESRRRLDAFVGRQVEQLWSPTGERLRTLRALEVLEHIGTTEAREVLTKLSKGAPEARVTREAKAALQRLERG